MAQKILIVDDESHIRMLINQTLEELEDEGVEFLSADNGEAALDLIQDEKPDLQLAGPLLLLLPVNGQAIFAADREKALGDGGLIGARSETCVGHNRKLLTDERL